jgi:hypothetical protein
MVDLGGPRTKPPRNSWWSPPGAFSTTYLARMIKYFILLASRSFVPGSIPKTVGNLLCPPTPDLYPSNHSAYLSSGTWEAMCYKPAVRGFESRWCRWIFNWPNPSSRTMAMGSTQPLTEKSTGNLSGEGCKGRPAGKATTSPPSVSQFSRKCVILDFS